MEGQHDPMKVISDAWIEERDSIIKKGQQVNTTVRDAYYKGVLFGMRLDKDVCKEILDFLSL